MNLLPLSLECLTSLDCEAIKLSLSALVKSLPQGSDLFIPLVPILSALGWMFHGLFVSEN